MSSMMSLRVAALAAFVIAITAIQAQAPAPGPIPYLLSGAVGQAPAVQPMQPVQAGVAAGNMAGNIAAASPSSGFNGGQVGTGPGSLSGPSVPGPAGSTTTSTGSSPGSPAPAGQSGPAATSPPATTSAPLAAPVVTFITRLNIDTPNTFNTGFAPGSTLTYAQAWVQNLENQYPGSIATATATAGSVNVNTNMYFPITPGQTNNPAAQASQLTAALQQIATNPSAAASLFPSSLGLGSITVSGISVSGNFAAAPAPAPMMVPAKIIARTISFLAHLSILSFESFTPTVQQQWCAQLTSNYPTATCTVTNIQPGSVFVTSSMGFAAGDNQAGVLLAQLQALAANPAGAAALFGPTFGNGITISNVADSNTAPAQTASTPSPPPAKHHLSGGKIAGAVIGSVVGAALLAGCGFAGYKYYKSRRSYSPATMA